MIVLPLNEEARSGRRPPWVTLVIVSLCVLSFLHHRGSDQQVDADTDAAIEEAWAYFEAHPYVKLDADVVDLFGEEIVATVLDEFREQLRNSGSPGIPDFVRSHDQFEFEGRIDAVYEAMEGHSFYRLGFFPEAMDSPDASFLTYLLAHEDWLHLVSNLLLVLLAGLFLEEVWGHALFALFAVLGTAGAAAGYATLGGDSADALGGASGLAAALSGAFLVRFAFVPIRYQYFVVPPFGGKFTAGGWVLLPIYGGLYLAADYLLNYGVPGIEPIGAEFATWAHVGGMAVGLGFAALVKLVQLEERFIHPKMEEKMTSVSNEVLDRALEAREAGRLEEAAELLAGEVARHPDDRDAALAYWDAAAAVGRPEQAADALVAVLRDEVSSEQNELAIQHWRELTQRAPDHPLDAGLETTLATALIESQEHDLAKFALQRVLDGEGLKGGAAHRVARIAQDLDIALALTAAHAALAVGDLDLDERKDVERLTAQLEAVRDRENEESSPALDGAGLSSGASYDFDAEGASEAEAASTGAGDGGEGASAGDGPDLLDGDTLNAEPFELDDWTEPPGVQTYDLESAGDATGESAGDATGESAGDATGGEAAAEPAAEAGAAAEETPFDPGLRDLGESASEPLPLDASPPSPPLEAPDPAALDVGEVSLEDASVPGLEDGVPGLEQSTRDLEASVPGLETGTPDLDASVPGLEQSTRDLEASVPGLETSTRDLDASVPGLEQSTRVLEASVPGLEHGAADPGASAPAADVPDLDSSTPDLSEIAPDLAEVAPDLAASSPDLGASTPDLDASTPDLAASTPDLAASTPDLGASSPDFGDSSPDLDASHPSYGDSVPDLEHTDSPLDLGGAGPDDSVQLVPPAPPSDGTDEPDYGQTMDMSDLGAMTIPGYLQDDPPVEPVSLDPAPVEPEPEPVAEPEPEPVPVAAPEPEPVPLPTAPVQRALKKMEAIPLGFGDGSVTLDVGERGKAQLGFDRIDAVAVAGVRGLRPKAVVVIDLIANWGGASSEPLKIVRLRSDRFDPANLVPDEENGFKALKRWLADLLERTGAVPLPDAKSAVGAPFQTYDGLEAYEREVLGVG